MEAIFAFALGLLAGVVTGILPGINILATMAILYPVLIHLEPVNAIILYVTLGACVNYFASVSGTFFGIVGSPTAIPSMIEGHALFKKGFGDSAIMHAAVGSFVASMIALLLTYILLDFLFIFYNLFNSRIKLIVFCIAIFVFVLTADNKWWISLIFTGLGLFLGNIGFRESTGQEFMTFGIIPLYSGLPLMPILLGLFVIPSILLNLESSQKKISFISISFSGYIKTFKEILFYRWTIIRSSFLGFVTGFVPGMIYVLGVSISHGLVKRKKQKEQAYKKGDLECLIAAECANSSGSLSVILPLLLIGIPITGTQAMIYSIATNSGVDLTIQYFQSMYTDIIIAFVMTSLICVFISGKYVNWIGVITRVNFNYVYGIVILILFMIVFLIGDRTLQGWYYLVVLVTLLPFGYILRKFDVTPIIYSFMLSDHIYYSLRSTIAILT